MDDILRSRGPGDTRWLPVAVAVSTDEGEIDGKDSVDEGMKVGRRARSKKSRMTEV